jgi:DNA-directed RNA polymerase subunit RPC12/RpoP
MTTTTKITKKWLCATCKEEIPSSYLKTSTSYCKPCNNKRSAEQRARKKLKVQQSIVEGTQYYCYDCTSEISDPLISTYYCKKCRNSRASSSQRKSYGPEMLAKHRKHRQDNTEIYRQYTRDWYKRNPEKKLQMNKDWRKNNPEAYRLLKHKQERPISEKCAAYVTPGKVLERMKYYFYKCAYCGGPFEHIDHVIPVSRGGDHWPANLRPSCRLCNQSKSNKPLKVWLAERIG